jgi:hypothetical protein
VFTLLGALTAVVDAVCQRCIENATGTSHAAATAELVIMGEKSLLGARRGQCGVCRTWTAVFNLRPHALSTHAPTPAASTTPAATSRWP